MATICCCSVAQSCPTLCSPRDCSTLGFPVLHHLPELAQTHVHGVSDSIQPSIPSVIPFSSCPQSFPTSGSFQMSQFSTLGGQSIGTSTSESVLPMNKYSGLISFRMNWFDLLIPWTCLSLPLFNHKAFDLGQPEWSILKSDWLYSLQPKMEKLYTVSKNKTGSWLWLRSWTPCCQIQT